MHVTVSSRHVELSEGVRRVAAEKIGRLERFLDGLERAEVHFSEEHNPRISERDVCEVTMEGHGHHIRAKVAASDPLAAVDVAVEKLEQQLHRLKTRLSPKGGPSPRIEGASRIDDGEDDDGPSLADQAYVTRSGEEVVKRKSFAIRPLSIDDAVLQLELLDHDFFFFTSVETGRPAVLYRRQSGGMGLIEAADGA